MNRVPPPAPEYRESDQDTDTGERRSRLGGAARKAILALGVFGLAWALARRSRSGDGEFSTDAIRERATEAMPDAVSDRLGSEARTERSGRTVGEVGGRTERVGSSPGETTFVDESMTDDEVEERVEADTRDEPAPPGEMNVDPEVAEKAVGDEADATERDEAEESSDEQ